MEKKIKVFAFGRYQLARKNIISLSNKNSKYDANHIVIADNGLKILCNIVSAEGAGNKLQRETAIKNYLRIT